mmetsp:Transcript_37260/g.111566  ORF Transcript_37260/g.111566 Transcript_37260/m.111566 type:complete len:234 (-) Transcript_37260:572-1273(-)
MRPPERFLEAVGHPPCSPQGIEYLVWGPIHPDQLVCSLDPHAGHTFAVVASVHDAHVHEHVVGPIPEGRVVVRRQVPHELNFLPLPLGDVGLEQHAGTAVRQQVGIFRHDQVDHPRVRQLGHLTIGLVRGHDEARPGLPARLDEPPPHLVRDRARPSEELPRVPAVAPPLGGEGGTVRIEAVLPPALVDFRLGGERSSVDDQYDLHAVLLPEGVGVPHRVRDALGRRGRGGAG